MLYTVYINDCLEFDVNKEQYDMNEIRNFGQRISEYVGELPGESEAECGNYLDHDLEKAKEYGKDMYNILKSWNVSQLEYPNKI